MRTKHKRQARRPSSYDKGHPRIYDRVELVKVLVGGGVLALLAVAYLLLAYTGRDQHGLLGIIGMGLGYVLRGRGGRPREF